MCRFLLEGQFKVHLLEGQLKVQGAGEGRAVRQIYTQIEPKLKRETACCPMALRQAEFIRKSDDQCLLPAQQNAPTSAPGGAVRQLVPVVHRPTLFALDLATTVLVTEQQHT